MSVSASELAAIRRRYFTLRETIGSSQHPKVVEARLNYIRALRQRAKEELKSEVLRRSVREQQVLDSASRYEGSNGTKVSTDKGYIGYGAILLEKLGITKEGCEYEDEDMKKIKKKRKYRHKGR